MKVGKGDRRSGSIATAVSGHTRPHCSQLRLTQLNVDLCQPKKTKQKIKALVNVKN
jgi:hypothetical protein